MELFGGYPYINYLVGAVARAEKNSCLVQGRFSGAPHFRHKVSRGSDKVLTRRY